MIIEKRNLGGIEGVDYLYWPQQDRGAFGTFDYGVPINGPLGDWYTDSVLFMAKVKKFDLVVQAGGNCGMYPRFYSNYFKKVVTFEPDADNFHCLEMNCIGDQYQRIHGALGAERKLVSINRLDMANVGMHKIDDLLPGDIQMHRLDDYSLEACDLIHFDLETYERPALVGATETIKKFKPVIITERSSGEDYILSLGYKKYTEGKMDTIYFYVDNL